MREGQMGHFQSKRVTDVDLAQDKITGPKAGVPSTLRIEVWFADADPDAVAVLQANVERCLGTRTLEGRLGQMPKAPQAGRRWAEPGGAEDPQDDPAPVKIGSATADSGVQ